MESQIRDDLREFINENFLFGDSERMPTDEESLLLSGVMDSTGILELIEFLESHFGIQVGEAETVPDNLGSVTSLTRYVLSKQ